jgi:hypothetical protein
MPIANDPTSGFQLSALPQPYSLPSNVGKVDVGGLQQAYANSLKNAQATALVGPQTAAAISQAKYEQGKNQMLSNLLTPQEQAALASYRAQQSAANVESAKSAGQLAPAPDGSGTPIAQAGSTQSALNDYYASLAGTKFQKARLGPAGTVPVTYVDTPLGKLPAIPSPSGQVTIMPLTGLSSLGNLNLRTLENTLDHYAYTKSGPTIQQGDNYIDQYDRVPVNRLGKPIGPIEKISKPWNNDNLPSYNEYVAPQQQTNGPSLGSYNQGSAQATPLQAAPVNESNQAPVQNPVQPSATPIPTSGAALNSYLFPQQTTQQPVSNPEDNIEATEEPQQPEEAPAPSNIPAAVPFVAPTINPNLPTKAAIASWNNEQKAQQTATQAAAPIQPSEKPSATPVASFINPDVKLTDANDPTYKASQQLNDLKAKMPTNFAPDKAVQKTIDTDEKENEITLKQMNGLKSNIANVIAALQADAKDGLLQPGWLNSKLTPRLQQVLGFTQAETAQGALSGLLSQTAQDYGSKFRNFGIVTQLLMPSKPTLDENPQTTVSKLQQLLYGADRASNAAQLSLAAAQAGLNPNKYRPAIANSFALGDNYQTDLSNWKAQHPINLTGPSNSDAQGALNWLNSAAGKLPTNEVTRQQVINKLKKLGVTIPQ